MKRCIFVFVVLFLLLILVISPIVSAESFKLSEYLSGKYNIFKEGDKDNNIDGGIFSGVTKGIGLWEKLIGGEGYFGSFLNYFLLALLIFFLYFALSSFEFIKNPVLRIVVSVIFGFLSTWGLNSGDFLAIGISYDFLGILAVVVLPIFLLGILTIFELRKATPFGLLVHRVLWVIYGIYLLIKNGLMLFVVFLYKVSGSTTKWDQGAKKALLDVLDVSYAELGNVINSTAYLGNLSILIIQVVVALVILWTFVWSYKSFRERIETWVMTSEVLAAQSKMGHRDAKIMHG